MAVSALTLAGIAQGALNILIQRYGAQSELCALSNEIADLMVVLYEMNTIVDPDSTSPRNLSPETLQILVKTVGRLKTLQSQIDDWKLATQQKKLKTFILPPKFQGFRANLQSLRSQLITILSVSSA